MMTDEQRMAILDEIIAATARPKQQPHQFTRREFAERKGVTVNMARTRLEKAVAAGILESTIVFLDGIRTWVYWRPGDDQEAIQE